MNAQESHDILLIPRKVIFGHDEQDAICCPNCETEIAMLDEYRYESVFY